MDTPRDTWRYRISMKVAIYTRVFGRSNRQDAANQSFQLIEYCQRQGWDYVEYTDRMSGTRADRVEFQRMFEDARLKHFDLVLFWADVDGIPKGCQNGGPLGAINDG